MDDLYCPECGNENIREPEEKGHYQCEDRSCLQEFFSDVEYSHKDVLKSKAKKIKELEAKLVEAERTEEALRKEGGAQANTIAYLKDKSEEYRKGCLNWQKSVKHLKVKMKVAVEAIKAYRALSICYRLSKNPTEKLFKELEKANDFLEEMK